MEGKVEKITIPLIGILNVTLFLAFFFAKIFDKIDWSWWLVFSPLWMPFVCIIAIISTLTISYLILILLAYIFKWKL